MESLKYYSSLIDLKSLKHSFIFHILGYLQSLPTTFDQKSITLPSLI